MSGGVSFDKDLMYKAAKIIDDRTNEELYKAYSALKTKIETEIGTTGTQWSGNQAGTFNKNFVEKNEPEFETLHSNIHNAADNIREQANTWQSFDEQ